MFLGLANGANVWQLGYYLVLSQQQWGSFVGTMLFLRLTAAGIGIFFAAAAVKRRMFVGTRLFRLTGSGAKLGETEPEPGCQMGVCLAAHTVAHSRQPRPPTDFSLQLKDDV